MQTAIILFAIFLNPDGTREAADVALFLERQPCEVVAAMLNESARKPADVTFACRVAQPKVAS